ARGGLDRHRAGTARDRGHIAKCGVVADADRLGKERASTVPRGFEDAVADRAVLDIGGRGVAPRPRDHLVERRVFGADHAVPGRPDKFDVTQRRAVVQQQDTLAAEEQPGAWLAGDAVDRDRGRVRAAAWERIVARLDDHLVARPGGLHGLDDATGV